MTRISGCNQGVPLKYAIVDLDDIVELSLDCWIVMGNFIPAVAAVHGDNQVLVLIRQEDISTQSRGGPVTDAGRTLAVVLFPFRSASRA